MSNPVVGRRRRTASAINCWAAPLTPSPFFGSSNERQSLHATSGGYFANDTAVLSATTSKMATSPLYHDFSTPKTTASTKRRHPFSAVPFLIMQVLLMAAAASAASDQLFIITRHACHCRDAETSSLMPSSFPWSATTTCECVCLVGNGASNCYSIGHSSVARKNKMEVRPKRKKVGRKLFGSPWIIPRGGATHEKMPYATANQQQQQQKIAENPSTQPTAAHSSSLASRPQHQKLVPLSSLPLIDTETVSLALRLTCETNRRLYHGTSSSSIPSSRKSTVSARAANLDSLWQDSLALHAPQHQQQQRQVMHPSSIPPAIRSISEEELLEERRREELSVFHATNPWEAPTAITTTAGDGGNITDSQSEDDEAVQSEKSSQPTSTQKGSMKWGPDLQSYLNTLLSSIGLNPTNPTPSDNNKHSSPIEDETQLILALTMLYLDRATSMNAPLDVDPITGRPWFPPCPYLVPRTVHRMVLTALAMATKCVRGYDPQLSTTLLEAANALFGSDNNDDASISQIDLEQMENWMLHALGGGPHAHHTHHHQDRNSHHHWQISQEEITSFLRKWGGTFYPQRLAAHDQLRMNQWERFWGGHRDYPTGHGNSYWPQSGNGGGGGGADHPHPHHPQQHQHAASLQYSSMEQHPSSHEHPQQQHSQNHHSQQQYYEELGSEPF